MLLMIVWCKKNMQKLCLFCVSASAPSEEDHSWVAIFAIVASLQPYQEVHESQRSPTTTTSELFHRSSDLTSCIYHNCMSRWCCVLKCWTSALKSDWVELSPNLDENTKNMRCNLLAQNATRHQPTNMSIKAPANWFRCDHSTTRVAMAIRSHCPPAELPGTWSQSPGSVGGWVRAMTVA